MRFVVIAIILLAAIAGCVNKPKTPTDTSSNNSTMPGGMAMTKELVNETHSFVPSTGAGTKPFTVDTGYSKLNITITFRPGSPAPVTPAGVSQGVSVKVGSFTCTLPDGPILPTMGPAPCNKTIDVTPGAMKVDYAGQGDVNARVIVIAS